MKSARVASAIALEVRTFDPGHSFLEASDFAKKVISEVETAWASGADLVLLPEFTWMALEACIQQQEPPGFLNLRKVAQLFEEECWPILQEKLTRADKAVILGTTPTIHSTSEIRNRAWIMSEGRWLFQDKLHLTPWESAFAPGQEMLVWTFRDLRCAVIICLDIEVPELSARLRDVGLDLVLCPSATETILGVERVNRCASARAVELGCYVAVSHLTGQAKSELIDENIGLAALYCPSQAAFQNQPREQQTPKISSGVQVLRSQIDLYSLNLMRRMRSETNPATLGRDVAGIERLIPLHRT
jgi:predicted amidohydrolase